MQWIKPLIDTGIIGLLSVLSVIAMGIAIERLLVFRSIRVQDFSQLKALELELSARLHIIATIGSNAPYIGLLGTVLGIMMTFYTIGMAGVLDTNQIMVGLALALKATAAGLIVAITSIIIYNLLRRQMRVLMMRWEIENG